MRKSTIWLLALVMVFAFGGLLYLQVTYVSIILKTSNDQFTETVKRSLLEVSKNLELDETKKYLEEDIQRDQNSFVFQSSQDAQDLAQVINQEKYQLQISDSDGSVSIMQKREYTSRIQSVPANPRQSSANNIVNTSRDLKKH